MPTIFDTVQSSRPQMSAFDLSHQQKLSFNIGELIPTYLQEIVPGDQFRVNSEIMLRFAPMVAPVMHNINVYMHYFFVPNRLVWNQWESFITGGQDGQTNPTPPKVTLNNVGNGSNQLAEYLGLPNQVNPVNPIVASAIPFRAYQLIYNEYYRDENLQEDINGQTEPGDIPSGNISDTNTRVLRRRCWEKDYLTSALPFAQRGPDANLPISAQYKDSSDWYTAAGNDPETGTPTLGPSINDPGEPTKLRDNNGLNDVRVENLAQDAFGVNINELRTASAIQRWLEKQARGGYRYIETILNHFGVRSSDSRLQRPQYLGGGKQPVVISEVLQTSKTDTTTPDASPQGTMAGHGYSMGGTNTFQDQFEEHGYVMGIMSVLPRTAYQQGIPRHFSRDDRYDYYWPEFAHLGEQEVKNDEVYRDPENSEYNSGTFGYQQRYAEYKYSKDTVHGDFRTNLDYWHMGRIFENNPQLNEEFVEYPSHVNAPDNRTFAVADDSDKMWAQLHHSVKARRPMPFFADPRLT